MLQPSLLASSSIRISRNTLPRTFCRYKSITAAIERARRDPLDERPARPNRRTGYTPRAAAWGREEEGRDPDHLNERPARPNRRTGYTPRAPTRGREEEGRDRFRKVYKDEHDHVDAQQGESRRGRGSFQRRRDSRTDDYGDRMSSFGPESLPYTTAASEFIYGYSSVLAALKANRRRLYKLYVLPRGLKNEGSSAILSRAASLNVTIQHVDDDYLRAFTKASRGRPHNGFIMETSPLPAPTIFALGPCSVINNEFQVNRAHQSKEEEAVNGKQRIFGYKSHGWRYPLVVYADGVLDEGNLGAIARSAYFLGADAIVTPMRKSAPWSHVAVKASVGAAEAIPIFKVEHPSEFLVNSAREGWRIYASGAIPPAPPVLPSKEHLVTEEEPDSRVVYTFARSGKRLPEKYSPVKEHPSILMMGAEDTGLRESLVSAAHYKVGIRQGREDEVGVDSLNVSVAASLLCFQMLQKPRKSRDALF